MDLAIKNAHFFGRFLRAFSIQNLDVTIHPLGSEVPRALLTPRM